MTARGELNDYRGLCRKCGGWGTGAAKCACGEASPTPGKREDSETLAACAEATELECVAPATLDGDVVVARGLDGSLVVRRGRGKYAPIDPAELLDDLETEIARAFTLELSRKDAEALREELEELGWRVGEGRDRRRNDLLGELATLDAAAEATGDECVSTAKFVEEESGETLADAVVARDAGGSFRLLDEIGYATLEPEEGFIVLLPQDADERIAAGLTEAGYAIPQPRMTLTLPSGQEFTCLLPHMRSNATVEEARRDMLAALTEHGPLACFQMSAVTGLLHRTLSARLSALQFDGLIRQKWTNTESGPTAVKRRCPVTGGSQHVYELGSDPARVGVYRVKGAASTPAAYTGTGRSRMVVDYIRDAGEAGATTSEITVGLGGGENGIVEHAVSAATSDLVKLEIVNVAGKRPSVVTGRPQSVFVLA